jgi:hypothetical protein
VSDDAPPREVQAVESAPERDYAVEVPLEAAREPDYGSEIPREPAPERDYAAEAPRPPPAETELVRSGPEPMEAPDRGSQNEWPRQERSFSEVPRDAGEQAASESSGESAPVPSNERQAG